MKPRNKLGDLVRTADKKNKLSSSDASNWSCKLHVTEIEFHIIPVYHINNSLERYREASHNKSELNLKEKMKVPRQLGVKSVKKSLSIIALC